MSARLVVPSMVIIASLLAAGCVGSNDHESPAAAPTTNDTPELHMQMQMNETNASAPPSNSTTTNQTYDYSSCMVGMDMPGCPASVAEKRYLEAQAKARPDKQLPPVKIALKPQGDGQTGAFLVENGTLQLLLTAYLNDSGPGPYAALGPGGMGDLKVELKAGASTKSITLANSANSAGVDPAVVMTHTYTSMVALPADGEWTVTVLGQGQNAQVTLVLVERFYS
ncbi:MAG: hypothetical protein WDA16_12985 [Candidatus Thermoplasmatota archaeon]